jgi:dihydrofolate synthase/folylpolyglutamate synthase
LSTRADGLFAPTTPLSYAQAVEAMSALQSRGWRLSLDRMWRLIELAGLDDAIGPKKPSFIHVAGTNGKGSVTAFLQSILDAQGWRVGTFLSPYVYDLRERIQLGREPISESDFARICACLLEAASPLEASDVGGITEFELKTAMGFAFWKEQRCDWVALEVGLGGRLDATNVVSSACGVIVSIGLDHTEILGTTHREIAREKAGILRPGVPAVVGQLPQEALEEVRSLAAEIEAPLQVLGEDFHLVAEGGGRWSISTKNRTYRGLVPGIVGAAQPANLAVAIVAAEAAGAILDAERIPLGAQTAFIPGRFQRLSYLGRTLILDGAHNGEAAEMLAQTLWDQGVEAPMPVVLGMLRGHDSVRFVEPLAPLISVAHICPIAFHRTREPADLVREISGIVPSAVPHASCEEALGAALSDARPGSPLLVTGSFYLVGEVGRLVGAGLR